MTDEVSQIQKQWAIINYQTEDDAKEESYFHAGTYVRLSVSDTGVGMTHELIDKIFDPYFTTKEVGKGSGMGLAVVLGIVKSHGGFIQAKSEPGKGSTFKVFFPWVKEEVVKEKIDKDEGVPTGTERILYIDDEEMLVDVGKVMLEGLGYSVTTEKDSYNALCLFQHDPARFDLVITDQTMPNIPGLELAERLLRIKPDVPIVLCTGYSGTVDESKAKKVGVREFLLKPIKRKVIAQVIRKVLDVP